MRLTFWYAEKGYEKRLGPALISGAAVDGDEVVMRPLEEYREPEGDGSIICGVVKREVLWDHQRLRVPLLYMDKGYHRTRKQWGDGSIPAWWRLCWNDVHPTHYLMSQSRPPDRFKEWGVTPGKIKGNFSGDVLILGSSAKFHHTMHLDHPTQWTTELAASIRAMTNRTIVYRPKPSWADAEPIPGTEFDHGNKRPVSDALAKAFVSVTYGSIACVDSIISGVPCVVLGNGVARPVSSRFIRDIPFPKWDGLAEREQWLANLAYSNFEPEEIANGVAWKILKEQMSYAL